MCRLPTKAPLPPTISEGQSQLLRCPFLPHPLLHPTISEGRSPPPRRGRVAPTILSLVVRSRTRTTHSKRSRHCASKSRIRFGNARARSPIMSFSMSSKSRIRFGNARTLELTHAQRTLFATPRSKRAHAHVFRLSNETRFAARRGSPHVEAARTVTRTHVRDLALPTGMENNCAAQPRTSTPGKPPWTALRHHPAFFLFFLLKAYHSMAIISREQ